jgi:hypothetical protein
VQIVVFGHGSSKCGFNHLLFAPSQNSCLVHVRDDATLQAMLAELVPFVGMANLTMTFGMQCWSLIGAQGKYKLATWISFLSS